MDLAKRDVSFLAPSEDVCRLPLEANFVAASLFDPSNLAILSNASTFSSFKSSTLFKKVYFSI